MDALPEMTPVVSTQIAAVGYAMDSSELVIEFIGGAVYLYEHVPPEVHAGLVGHASIGAYFYKHIKYAKGQDGALRYPYTKLRGPTGIEEVQTPATAAPGAENKPAAALGDYGDVPF